MEKFYIRQGDILFERVESKIRKEKEELKNEILTKIESKTVALGELTGHHHSFQKTDQVMLYKTVSNDVPTQASVLENGPNLSHQEHLSIQFPKGEYVITREQSYNPFLKAKVRSMD